MLDEAGLLRAARTAAMTRARATGCGARARRRRSAAAARRRAAPLRLASLPDAAASIGSIEPALAAAHRRRAACRSRSREAPAGASPRRPTRRSPRSRAGCTPSSSRRAGATSCSRSPTPTAQRSARVERGVVRVLGITTYAVHLVGSRRDGAVWVQQRAFDKATDPGLLGHADGRPGRRRRVDRARRSRARRMEEAGPRDRRRCADLRAAPTDHGPPAGRRGLHGRAHRGLRGARPPTASRRSTATARSSASSACRRRAASSAWPPARSRSRRR